MSTLEVIANLFSYACFNLGALLVWPSRRNILAWLGLPFFVTAYLIPLMAVDYTEVASQSTIESLTLMNAIGAVAMLVGLLVGGRVKLPSMVALRLRRPGGVSGQASPSRATFRVLTLGCVVMSLCFAWMGFLPLFADEPFLAKFFRGSYKEKYDQVSIFYRFSQTMVAVTLPLALALFVGLRERKMLLPILWAMLLFGAALNRGTVLAGAILLTAAWASRTRLRMSTFLLGVTAIYCLGSSIYVLLGIFAVDDLNIWIEIARGAPDVSDHLTFLQSFIPAQDFTYGLTFVGGLIPGNFAYNPSIYTLAVVNGSFDVSDVSSGGFRLPPSISGYMAFSWLGVVFVPLLQGLLTGYFTTRLRSIPRQNLTQQVAGQMWFQLVAGFVISFYAMSYQGLISLFLFVYLVPDIRALGGVVSKPLRPGRFLRLRLRRGHRAASEPRGTAFVPTGDAP